MKSNLQSILAAVACWAALPGAAKADAVTDWNAKTSEFIAEARMGTPPAVRLMALTQTAAHESLRSPAAAAHPDAAIAAAHRSVLLRLLPAQSAAIEQAYQTALQRTPEGPKRGEAVAAGIAAAEALLAVRLQDGGSAPDAYRPLTTAGTYVPTASPAVPHWPQRKPWLMTHAAQFRPGPPPDLASETWARDFEETKRLGARTSQARTAEQGAVAKFWEFSLPSIYFGVVRSVADQPGRSLTDNARLYAMVAQAMDDALIAVFDAKYQYQFWRPVTAIRNADQDRHPSTERDAAWASLIEAPMHPEYPSGHSILASTVARVLDAEMAGRAMPLLSTVSPTAGGARRTWIGTAPFTREVSDARIHAGIHFRFSTDTAERMGVDIAGLAIARFLSPARVAGLAGRAAKP
ncbi:MAG: vanadium-dependent haloperoxidase [Betaproteobacteria bacterium]|nr:vanadium-dependent haloperoxidase [Betaproteobacteria bacterium]